MQGVLCKVNVTPSSGVTLTLHGTRCVHFRNKFHFSEVHGSMNARVTCKVSDARDSLRSYFQEPQKNEIHLLYLHFDFTSFLEFVEF